MNPNCRICASFSNQSVARFLTFLLTIPYHFLQITMFSTASLSSCALLQRRWALPRRLAEAGQQWGVDLLGEPAEFNRAARALLATSVPPGLTLAEMLAESGLSAYFADHVVLPLISIIWSNDMATAGRYPVGALLAFLDNHGMLMVGEATRWRTVTGGSAVYVERVASRLTEVLRGTPVRAVRRIRTESRFVTPPTGCGISIAW